MSWLRATFEDFAAVDFEAPIREASTADSHEVSRLYRTAVRRDDALSEPAETSESRVFTMLAALTSMHFKPKELNEPFGPMVSWGDGRQSAVPSDFQGHLGLLDNIADQSTNPVLRARISDICWLLDRKRGRSATKAITAYTDIVQKVRSGELKFELAQKAGALQHDARDYLTRAIQIGRAVGWDKPETIAARDLARSLREEAIAGQELIPLNWFSNLDLEYRLSDPAEIGATIDHVLVTASAGASFSVVVDLWRLAARAYHLAKMDEDKNRCLSEAAEALVAEAEARQGSAVHAAHFLSLAIAQLHGIPGKRERRTSLHHKLLDVQARVPDEMGVFSQEINLSEIVQEIEKVLSSGSLLDKLFVFAALDRPPEMEKLVGNAEEIIQRTPFSSLLGASHLDRHGKTVHRTPAGLPGQGAEDESVRWKIVEAESVRRKLVVAGRIEPARNAIIGQHFISEDVLESVLQYSPFVPPELVRTFARGTGRFLQGDFVSSTYILNSLLEGSLRYLLKSAGHNTAKFDDATQIQEERTISILFEQMRTELEEILTPAIVGDIERVFLSKPGPTLRHSVAHSLLNDADPYSSDAIYGCWLILRLCLLPLYPDRAKLLSMFSGTELVAA